MSLTAPETAAVVGEIAPALAGGWIQKIFQPTSRAIVLEIRASGYTVALLLSADPDAARVHLSTNRPPNPAVPPPFCQFLRAHIQGARIEGVEQLHDAPIVRLRLTSREGACSLMAELVARRADLLVLDAEDKVVTTLNTGQERAGRPYEPPAVHPRAGADSSTPPTQSGTDSPFPVSLAVEQASLQREEELARTRARQARLVELRKKIKRTVRRIAALQSDLEKAAAYREYARYGELLKANLGQIKKGQQQVTVVDYFDPGLPELTIPLDSAKSPQGNMDDYFKKHRKYLTADQEIKPRLASAERECEALQAERVAVEQGTWEPPAASAARTPREPGGSAATRGARGERKAEPARSGPFKRFTSADGIPIYVGRNARENEELTFKFARPDDLWLHAHGTPGSHVVVRLEKGANPPPETLRDAATLALLYSDMKKSGKGEVIYSRRKWVRKAKGQAPGAVTVTQEKAIFVTLDRPRLDRLKERPA